MARATLRKSLTALKFLAASGAIAVTAAGGATIALATTGAYAMALNNAVRIGPGPAMGHVDGLGGRINPHNDRIFGPGGDSSQDECYRRNYVRLEKLDTSKNPDSIADKARRLCGT